MIINLNDPQSMAGAVANGHIWSSDAETIAAACKRIAAGEIPMPSYVPPYWLTYLSDLKGEQVDLPLNTDGSGPA